MQAGQGLFAQAQAVLLRHSQRVGAGGGVGAGGAGGDHVQRVADDVGQNDRIDRCRGAGLGKAAALDAGQALAHRVHLDDVGAAGQQLPGDVLQFPAGDQRLLKQRAAAAGQQKQHGVAGAQAADQFQRPAGGGKAVFVRHRVAGLVAGTAGQLALDMAVFRHHHAGGKPAAQAFHRGAGHLPGRLAGGDQQHPAGERLVFQCAADGLVRQHRMDGLPDNGVGVGAQAAVHGRSLRSGWSGPVSFS